MDAIEKRTMEKVSWRLLPFLMACYFVAYLDRVNVGFAGASMTKDLGLTQPVLVAPRASSSSPISFSRCPATSRSSASVRACGLPGSCSAGACCQVAQAWVAGDQLQRGRLLLGIAEAGFFPRHDLLSHLVVPGRLSGADRRFVYVRHPDLDCHRLADLRAHSQLGRRWRACMAGNGCSPRGFAGAANDICGPLLFD